MKSSARLSRASAAVAVLVSLIAPAAQADQPAAPATPPGEPPPPVKHETPHEMAVPVVPQPTPPPSAVPAPTPEELRRRRVTVRIDSTRPNNVFERRVSVKESTGAFVVLPYRDTESTWEQVCVTPCEVDLDRFSTYRVRAQNHVSASRDFTLPQKRDALHLNIDSGSLLAHRAGQSMSVVGITALVVGVSLLATAENFRHPNDARIAGGATGGAGLALAAIGIPLAYMTTSKVSGDDDQREIAKVYNNHGFALPLLPDIKLTKTMTLTQRGIIF